MTERRPATSADRISSYAVILTGMLCGVLVFVVALPLALSSPFPTPKQGEWIIQTSSFEVASLRSGPTMPLVPPPMEPLPVEPPAITGSLGDRYGVAEPVAFAARWNLTDPVPSAVPRVEAPRSETPAVEALHIEVPPQATRLTPADVAATAAPKHREISILEAVDEYLWQVYQRLTVKSDSTGDFTWKDQAAAKRRGMSLQTYVIGGMDPDFREQLYHAGHAMDANGIRWSMLSAFRDDYRQALASGFKAHGGNSQHGGSIATGGYGHGRAIDITAAAGEPETVWHWIDVHGPRFGLRRPMPGADPAHIQPQNTFHDLAHQLREARVKLAEGLSGTEPAATRTKMAARTDDASEGRRARR